LKNTLPHPNNGIPQQILLPGEDIAGNKEHHTASVINLKSNSVDSLIHNQCLINN